MLVVHVEGSDGREGVDDGVVVRSRRCHAGDGMASVGVLPDLRHIALALEHWRQLVDQAQGDQCAACEAWRSQQRL